jgi:hypothetical protein
MKRNVRKSFVGALYIVGTIAGNAWSFVVSFGGAKSLLDDVAVGEIW